MPKSELTKEKREGIDVEDPNYSPEEEAYLKNLYKRMEGARDLRDQPHDEFNGRTYQQRNEANERHANTFVTPKKNKHDTNFVSGTIRQKIMAVVAALNNLNLFPDISAYDQSQVALGAMGNAMEDTFKKNDELDGDEEKKLLRQYEMLKHGDVFVQEIWEERFTKIKSFIRKFKGFVTGDQTADWTERLKPILQHSSRKIISGLHVYLGNIRQYEISLQPYLFAVEYESYEETKSIYGKWERWKSVRRNPSSGTIDEKHSSLYNQNWSLHNKQDGQCEIIKYQDKWNNEFAIVINGVLMTPVGLPFVWGYNEYNITQQGLEPIHAHFAYRKSLPERIGNNVAIYDEMLRLAVLKTQKSFAPPYLNLSGRVVSSRVFMPGKITHGLDRGSLVPLHDKESQGVTASEFSMIEDLKASIDSQSVSPTFSGQQTQGQTTATEILELQRQTRLILGLTVFAMQMLEWKLAWLRLYTILQNWFKPKEEVLDEMKGTIKRKFRDVSTKTPIDGEGFGDRVVIPTDELPTPAKVKEMEERRKADTGRPTRMIFVRPDVITGAKIIWQIAIRPRAKRTNELSKLLFRAMLQDAQVFANDLNMEYLEQVFAETWDQDPNKLFKRGVNQQQLPEQPTRTTGPTLRPRVPISSGEGLQNQNITNALQ